jgi:hypothetical protein
VTVNNKNYLKKGIDSDLAVLLNVRSKELTKRLRIGPERSKSWKHRNTNAMMNWKGEKRNTKNKNTKITKIKAKKNNQWFGSFSNQDMWEICTLLQCRRRQGQRQRIFHLCCEVLLLRLAMTRQSPAICDQHVDKTYTYV